MNANLENDFNFQEQLRRYAVGELSPSEREALESALKQSPEAAAEAGFSLRLADALQHREQLQVSALVGGIIAEEGLPPVDPSGSAGWLSVSKNFKWLLGVAAVLVMGLAVYQLAGAYLSPPVPVQQLTEDYLQPLENVLYTEDETIVNWELKAGMEAYDAGDYAAAADRLAPYYEAAGDPNAGLFLGVTLLMNKQAAQALPVLSEAAGALQGPGREAAQWYMAMAWLQKGQAPKARRVLRAIPEQSIYYAQAQSLLGEIKPGWKKSDKQ